MLTADEEGRCSVELGLGGVGAHASAGALMAEKDVDTAEVSEVELVLATAETPEAADAWHDVDVRAPEDHPAPSQPLSPEAAARGRVRKAVADESRGIRVAAMRSHAEQLARQAALVRPGDDAELVARILEVARGNADAV